VFPPPLAVEGQGGDYPISVVTAAITDTCKEVVDGLVRATMPRETLVEVRGPWLVTREGLADTLARAVARAGEITDMLSLCDAAGVRVRTLPMK
jgi:2-C-methyl-D-erythritol 4-phosphate cytidylyltransferase